MKNEKKIYESLTVTTWLIVGIILLIVLITSPKWKTVQTASNTYGPYECEGGQFQITADEWKHRVKLVQDMTIKIVRNWNIITTEDFDKDNIGFTYRLPRVNKCIPLMIRGTKETVQSLWACLEKIIGSNQLRSDILSKNGTPFELCSVSEYVEWHEE